MKNQNAFEGTVQELIEIVKVLGDQLESDFILLNGLHRIEFHRSARAIVIESRQFETVKLEEDGE